MADGAQEVRTAIELWAARVAASGSRPAFRYPRDGGFHAMTFGEVDAAAREIAAGLASLGVGRGESVCILSQSRLEWVLSQLGILLAGGVTVPIYGSNTAEQSAFIVKDSGARVIIAEDAAQLEKVVPLLDQIPGLRLVHMADDARLEKPDARGRTQVTLTEVTESIRKRGEAPLTLEAVREAGRTWARAHPEELARRTATIGPGDVFTIIYTSGTTGNPKGVLYSHRSTMIHSIMASNGATIPMNPDTTLLPVVPMFHANAWGLVYAAPMSGAKLVFPGPTLDGASVYELLDK